MKGRTNRRPLQTVKDRAMERAMERNTSILEGVQTPKLSTTSGKNTPPASSTKSLCHASFSISLVQAAKPGKEAEHVITPE